MEISPTHGSGTINDICARTEVSRPVTPLRRFRSPRWSPAAMEAQHRWVPYVAYGAAALVGFSRMTLSAHFPSDVFMGAALGYSISRFTVLRQ